MTEKQKVRQEFLHHVAELDRLYQLYGRDNKGEVTIDAKFVLEISSEFLEDYAKLKQI